MSRRWGVWFLALACAGCGSSGDGGAADARPPTFDAAPAAIDAPVMFDAAPAIDASVDAPIVLDAPIPFDAAPPDATAVTFDATPAIDAAPPDGAILGAVPVFEVETLGGAASTVGGIALRFPASASAAVRVVNVVADLDGSGTIGAYAAGGGTQEEWLIKNAPVFVRPDGVSTHLFDLLDATAAGKPIRLRVVFGDGNVVNAPSLAGATEIVLAVNDAPDVVSPAPGYIGAGGGRPASPRVPEGLDDEPRDVDVTGGYMRMGIPDPFQNENSCVLDTIAAQLSWLARKNGFADCVKGTVDPFGEFNATTDEGVHNLGTAIDGAGGFGWTAEDGVLPAMVLPGKQALTTAWNLPITTTLFPGGDSDVLAGMKTSMMQGCAVELIVVTAGGSRHMVGITGFTKPPRPAAVQVQDSASEKTGEVYNTSSGTGNQRFLDGFRFQGQRQRVLVDALIVECPAEVRTLTLDYAHGGIPTGEVVMLSCITGGHSGEHGSGCECGEHYHGADVSIKGGPPVDDNFPNACGHGCVGTHPFAEVNVACCGPQ